MAHPPNDSRLTDYLDEDIVVLDDSSDDAPPIVLPYNYHPRPYQAPFWGAMFPHLFPQFRPEGIVDPIRRAVMVWHRRAGKDKTVVNAIMTAASERVGLYLYMLPTGEQARLTVWQGTGKDGMPFIAHFPQDLVASKNEARMEITLTNGSIIKLTGSDTFDRKMGSNPVGIVFSEWSISDPLAWDYFRPILAENDGWAIWIYTPRGKNHGWTTYERARVLSQRARPVWYCERLQTLHPDQPGYTGAISEAAIEEERDSGMSDEMIEQEFGTSFEAMSDLIVFGKQMQAAYDSDRIVDHLEWTPGALTYTFWDLGVRDTMFIIFAQAVGQSIHIPLIIEDRGYTLGHYIGKCKEVKEANDLIWGKHFAPHDIEVREQTSGDNVAKTRKVFVKEKYGWRFEDGKQYPLADQIEAGRTILGRCVMSSATNGAEKLVSALTSWQFEDEEKREPMHNWASHGSSALMTLAMNFKKRFYGDKNYSSGKVINLFDKINPLDV